MYGKFLLAKESTFNWHACIAQTRTCSFFLISYLFSRILFSLQNKNHLIIITMLNTHTYGNGNSEFHYSIYNMGVNYVLLLFTYNKHQFQMNYEWWAQSSHAMCYTLAITWNFWYFVSLLILLNACVYFLCIAVNLCVQFALPRSKKRITCFVTIMYVIWAEKSVYQFRIEWKVLTVWFIVHKWLHLRHPADCARKSDNYLHLKSCCAASCFAINLGE